MTLDDVTRMFQYLADRSGPDMQVRWMVEVQELGGRLPHVSDSFLAFAYGQRSLLPEEHLCAGILFHCFGVYRPSCGEKLRPVLKRMIVLVQDPAWVDALVTCTLGGPDALRGFIEQQTGETWPL